MKKSKILFNALALFAVLPLISSCGLLQNNSMTREEAYPELYAQKPLSIVIMPPINQTNKVEAKEAVYASLYKPLVERGYYVFSPMLAQELLQSESADDAELFLEGNLKTVSTSILSRCGTFYHHNKMAKDVRTIHH